MARGKKHRGVLKEHLEGFKKMKKASRKGGRKGRKRSRK
jgi:hypothetical protein